MAPPEPAGPLAGYAERPLRHEPRLPDIPKPPRFRYATPGDPRGFFTYWAEVLPHFPDRIQCYVYRTWPVLDRQRLNKTKFIDKPTAPIRGEAYKDELLHQYGSGGYKLVLSDIVLGRVLCQAFIDTPMELSDHPPLLALEDLWVEHPQNKSYVEFLRRRGEKLPGDPGSMSREEGETVAETTSAVQALSTAVIDASQKMVAMAERQSERKGQEQSKEDAAKEKPATQTASDMSAGVKVVADAAAIGYQMMKDAIADSSKVASANADPMALVDKIITISQGLVPKAVTAPATDDTTLKALREIYAQVSESAARRADLMEQILWSNMGFNITHDDKGKLSVTRQQYNPLAAGAAGTGAAPGTPGGFMGAAPAEAPRAPTILGELENMAKIKHALEDAGILPAAELAEKKGWLEYMPLIMTGIQFITGSIASIMYNRAVASGQGQPIPPPMPDRVQIPGMEAQPPGPGSYPQPVPTTAAPAPMPGPGPQGGDMNLGGMITFLRKIEQPLLNHLKQGASGADFADWMIMSEEQGQLIYDSIVEAGKASLIQLLQLHPPIWNVATSIPQRFDAFLDEFLNPPTEEEQPAEPAPAPRVMARHRAPQMPQNESVKIPDAAVQPPDDLQRGAAPAPAPGLVIDIQAEHVPSGARAARVKSPAAGPAGDAL